MHAALHGAEYVAVICDDTDVFVLLLHFYSSLNMYCNLLMEVISAQRSTVDIKAICKAHAAIVSHCLPAHAKDAILLLK